MLAALPIHPVTITVALRVGQIDGENQAKGVRLALAHRLIGVTALELASLRGAGGEFLFLTSPLSKNLSDNSCRINRILAKFLASVTPAEAQSTALIGSLTGGGNRFHFHSYSTTFQKTALRRDRRKPIFSSYVIGMPPNRSEIRRGEAPSRGCLARILSSSGNSLL
jgi:hypothetical protein